MKKILVLNYEFPPLGGGAGNATYYLLKEFSKKSDIEIDLITSSTGKYSVENFSPNIRIHRLNIGKSKKLHSQSVRELVTYAVKAFFFAKKLIKRNKYDLVHAFFGIPCGYIPMKLGLPYIVSLRGSDVPFYNPRFKWADKFLFQYISRKVWRGASSVIANSEDLKNLALKTSPNQEIKIIENGVDCTEFCPSNKKDGFVILSTSRLTERKGVDILIRSFALLSKTNTDARLIIAGDGDMRDELESLVKSLNIKNKVNLLGTIKHSEIADLYKKADVFVLASSNEGMSNSLLEALASELAIITTNVGGAKKLSKHNEIIIVDRNVISIYNALTSLSSNVEKLNLLKKESRFLAEKMDWSKIADQYIESYKIATKNQNS